MKKAILLPCFLLGGLSLMAQSQHQPHHPVSQQTIKSRKLMNSILAKQTTNATTANKPTTIQQRVIAQAFVSSDHAVNDSLKYKYGGTRTSKYDFNNADFQYNTTFQTDYLPLNLSVYLPPNAYLQADTIFDYQQNFFVGYSNAFYRSDNKVDSFAERYISGSTTYTQKTLHRYNTLGYITQAMQVSNVSPSTSIDTNQVVRYFYNTDSLLLSDTSYDASNGVLSPFSADEYHYNQQNMIDSVFSYDLGGIANLGGITAIQYNADKQITNLTGYELDNNQDLVYLQSDSFGYTPNISFYTFHSSISQDIENNFVDGAATTKFVGTNNLPDSMTVISFDQNGMYDFVGYNYTFNSYNNPVTLIATSLIDTSYAGQTNFYYETFEDTPPPPPPPPIAINDIKNNKDFSIYPNPFDNKLNIDWKGAKAHQTKIALVNILGQTVYSTNQNLVTGTNSINLPNLIKGNYVLLIQDAKGNTWKSQLVKN